MLQLFLINNISNLHSDISFKCLMRFTGENICKKADIPYKKSVFDNVSNPVLISELSPDTKDELADQMDELKDEIHTKFAKVQCEFIQSIENRKVSPTNLALTLRQHLMVHQKNSSANVPLFKEQLKEINEAKTSDEILKIINDYYCYYNYEILKHMIDVHGTLEDQKRMNEYISKFSHYCRKLPCVEFHDECNPDVSKRTKLGLKLDYDMDLLKGIDIKRIIRKVAKILGIRPSVLFFSDVKKGCVEITFVIPTFLIGHLLTLIYDKISIVRQEVHMISVYVDFHDQQNVLVCINHCYPHYCNHIIL